MIRWRSRRQIDTAPTSATTPIDAPWRYLWAIAAAMSSHTNTRGCVPTSLGLMRLRLNRTPLAAVESFYGVASCGNIGLMQATSGELVMSAC